MESGRYIPIDKDRVEIPTSSWNDDKKTRVEKVHNSKSSKEMWETLALAYKGTSYRRQQVIALKVSKGLKKLSMKAKERVSPHPSKFKELRKDHHPKPSKLRNLVKKPLKKKVLIKTSSPLYQGRFTLCGNIKEDPDGRATSESTPKKSKTKVKWCTTNARSLNTSIVKEA
ncbi:hypothetical protein CR513_12535, partial [Mucuna pruriens]